MDNISIIEFPSNLGLREPEPGKEPGVKGLPAWLKKHHFHDQIQPGEVLTLLPPAYSPRKDPATRILNAEGLYNYALQQAALLGQVLDQNKFPLVLGGDCSILLGPAIALKQRGHFGLFYLDGHTDFMNISFSQSGGIGGMAASFVTGNGHEKLANIEGLSPYIKEENLWCVGNREYDDAYEDEVRNSRATYKSLEMLRKEGISNCTHAFLEEAKRKKLDGFWLHIDVDVLDDEIMPCVDSRTPGGLTYNEFNQLTAQLFKSEMLTGVEITILDPDLDSDGKYTREFVKNLTRTLHAAREWIPPIS